MININEDLKMCKDLKEQYKKLRLEEGGEEVFKLSQLSLAMYDRLNEIRLRAKDIRTQENYTKSELKEYIRAKMKLMESIHIQCRAAVISNKDDKKFTRY